LNVAGSLRNEAINEPPRAGRVSPDLASGAGRLQAPASAIATRSQQRDSRRATLELTGQSVGRWKTC